MTRAPDDQEIVLAFPAPTRGQVPVATKFRSTWLSSSLRALRKRARLDEYFGYLPIEHHEAVKNSVAGLWSPIGVAVAHYEACDRLVLPVHEVVAIGKEVHTYAQATVFSLAVKLAAGAGATPWTVFAQFRRWWSGSGSVGASP